MGRRKRFFFPLLHIFPRGGWKEAGLVGLKRDMGKESVWRGKVTWQRGMLLEVEGFWGVVSQSFLNLTANHIT